MSTQLKEKVFADFTIRYPRPRYREDPFLKDNDYKVKYFPDSIEITLESGEKFIIEIKEIKYQNDNSKWVAVTCDKEQKVISEDKDPRVVRNKADNTGKEYYLMFSPDPDKNFIFSFL